MKKNIVSVIFFVSLINGFSIKAEGLAKRYSTKITFDKGTFIGTLGVGIMSPYYAPNSSMTVPPISGFLEYGVMQKLGVGLGIGYAPSVYKFGSVYEINYSNLIVNLRIAFHFINRDKLDIYAGGGIGYNISSATVKDLSGRTASYADPTAGKTFGGIAPCIFIGGRYYLSNQIALFGEAGYSISFATLGITFRFQ